MKKRPYLTILSTLTLYLFLIFFAIPKPAAQYIPYLDFLNLQRIQYNQPIIPVYPGFNSLSPFNNIYNQNQNITYNPSINTAQGSSWNILYPNPYSTLLQQFSNLNLSGQNQYQVNAGTYLPLNTTSGNQINLAYKPSLTPASYQTGSISYYSSQAFAPPNQVANYYTQGWTPLSYPQSQNIGLSGSFNQGYFPYSNPVQGQVTLNYYGNTPLSGQVLSQNYLPNSYYSSATTGATSADTIRVTSILEAELVLASPEYGMYCYDPPTWLNAGYQVGIWCYRIPIRAQSFDKRGRLFNDTPGFSVEPTNESGVMEVFDSSISLYRGIITAKGPADYLVTVVVDSASIVTTAKRRSATCEICHPTPPGHIAVEMTWGNCHECHNLGDKLHRHAFNAFIPKDKCYTCHPNGCLSGVHGQRNVWCTACHGTLEDASYGRMKISGQLGKPQCADCHDPMHSEPGSALFVDSSGHGGVWCINCHGATHVEVAQPVGLNNCKLCHTIQANIGWMGPNCALCHGSSFSPHFVTN